ncbi:2Fe-2S iron-sulfur cluster-binding protein [Streptomyces sp. NBC_01373]|uniref:2Fe-2S iron-sulfur cluster-binding protein n=1 Tax=unclassified Streptomyces TaxID=2593676 RepID=UPI00224E1610|nr:2Fe-2S iron-sulfur cluster-binding protein [Streptomyces sp. NBC_01373]MCX4700369.1 2Fe-2S iron-sulfur cluster-binding protein [Streptomyces sp. NBC_01373]
MTDDQHGEGTPQGAGRWDPLPQGDYDDGATAFVKLPEGGIDALLASADPLAAPGHGYVPPQITANPAGPAGNDPAATDAWARPAEGVQWPDPNAAPQDAGNDRFTYNPGATGQWNFEETGAPAPGHDVTGQWSIPVAGGDLPDESGEFTTSSLVEQWGGTPPATLPGGAPAPWATEGAGQPWAQQVPAADPSAEAGHAHEQPAAHAPGEGGLASAAHAPRGFAPDTDAPVEPGPAGHDHEQPRSHTSEAPARPSYAEASDAPTEPPYTEAPAEPVVAASQAAHGGGEAGEPDEASEEAQGAAEAVDEAAEPPVEHALEADADEESARTPDGEAAPPPPPSGEEHPLASYVLRVNGVDRPVTDAWIGESLLYVLRERLGLAGAKDGCSQGECGACNVQVDGRLVASCLVPAVTAAGSEVRTVEGLAVDGQPSDVQRALARCGAVQCGFCVPGMAMTLHDLLEGNPAPSEMATRQALCGNLCRCSGYRGVVEAVKEVVAEREAHSAADAETDADEARIPHQAGPGAGGVNPSAFEPVERHDHSYRNGQGQDGGQA